MRKCDIGVWRHDVYASSKTIRENLFKHFRNDDFDAENKQTKSNKGRRSASDIDLNQPKLSIDIVTYDK